MKLCGQTFAALLSLAFLGALGVGGYFVLIHIADLFASIDFQVGAVTLIVSAAALIAASIIASSVRQASKQNKTNQLRAKKIETYQLFIDLWESLRRDGGDSEDRGSNTVCEDLLTLDRRLILYGSPEILKAYATLRALERKSGAHDPHAKSQFAKVLMQIRKDLGSETQDLTAEELQQLLCANSEKVTISAHVSTYQSLQPRVSLASNA